MLDKIKEKINPSYEDEYEYEEMEVGSENKTTTKKINRKVDASICLVQPVSYQEAKEIGDEIKLGKGIILNLHNLSNEDGVRVIDFISGIVHAVEGTVKKIAVNTFICLPSSIAVEGQITTEVSEAE